MKRQHGGHVFGTPPVLLAVQEAVERMVMGVAALRLDIELAELVARARMWLGGAIVVVLASLVHMRRVAAHLVRTARRSLRGRYDVVWGALAVSTMSVLVGWVITRLP